MKTATKYDLQRQVESQAARIAELQQLLAKATCPACPVYGWISAPMNHETKQLYMEWARNYFEPLEGYADRAQFGIVEAGWRRELPTALADGVAILFRYFHDSETGCFVDDCWFAIPEPNVSRHARKHTA